MRAILAGAAVAVLTVAAGGSAPGQAEKIDGKLLVGKWRSGEKSNQNEKVFLEFTTDGKVLIAFDVGGGKEFKLDGTYKLTGDKLAVKMSFMGEDKSQTLTVNKLTATELVTTDEEGKKEVMIRVSGTNKKKD